MKDEFKRISFNPINAYGIYDVVYLGNIIPKNSNMDLSRKLRDEYVFVFRTINTLGFDENAHGRVFCSLEKEYKFSHFGKYVLEKVRFHNLELGSNKYKINDFIEIEIIEFVDGFKIVANFKNQINEKILLVNNCLGYKNMPSLMLNSEFELQLKIDEYLDNKDNLKNCENVLNKLKSLDEDEKNAIKLIRGLLNKEITSLDKLINTCEDDQRRVADYNEIN